jgi:predicted dehydrogenase
MRVLIVGLGSIAKKHICVLKEINPKTEIYALRSSLDSKKQKDVINLYNWNNLINYNFSFAIISSPSFNHLDHLIKAQTLKIPIMIEKPLFISLEQIQKFDKLKLKSNLCYIACNFRFHPLIIFLKDFLKNNRFKINEINVYCGSFLPGWRVDKDYTKIYSSIKKMGGGVHLDLIHEIDYLVYLFGLPFNSNILNKKVSKLNIDSVDYSNIIFDYKTFCAQITLNYFRKDYKRTLEIVFENKTLLIDFKLGKIFDLSSDKTIYELYDFSIYDTYKRQMKYFLNCIKSNQLPINSVEEASSILKLIL